MQLLTKPNLDKLSGKRITTEEAINLYLNTDCLELGDLADQIRKKHHPDAEPVTFVIDRNINYTNACTTACRFCAFAFWPGDKRTYINSYEIIHEKTKELVELGGTQLLLQGGHNPELKIEYYEDLLKRLKTDFSDITLHALSPSEVDHVCNVSKLDIETVLRRLINAGLDSIPGGGAEILVDRVRDIISPLKIKSDRWLEVMEVAHRLGLKTTATMMFGHVETFEERLEHMEKIRQLQEKYCGFTAFIPWTFQKENNSLGRDIACNVSTSIDYLRTLAVSRIYLDNVINFQSSWVTQGIKIGQIALAFGANDMGGTMLEENVVSAAGTSCPTSMKEIIHAIHKTGRDAAQRDTQYNIIKVISRN
ncbi:MAG: dehypoxanthine futalosine cyclase [Candidatus Melainabacteria bacterium RIFCSPLOWO2_02_FULL_35_15]|nr:MAG: dehypoxanthine futalosine cyclase [Candidatus Melainabacteria bacterium RIFCSPLOWO2_12_FULL_35_11]OGI13761.1 MAG: dehypoxanthine futalosine cyclase [Candidatus Melainabacteria bacterium RIFCSPLOWO2_02_FULL_35_15]